MKIIFWLTLLSLVCSSGACLAGDVTIIANPSVKENSLSQNDIKKIFLSKKKTLEGGAVKLVIQEDDTIHDAFLRNFVKKSSSQFRSYYKKLIFTGRGQAPKRVANDKAMISYVANTPGAIGYVAEAADTVNVKIIHIQ